MSLQIATDLVISSICATRKHNAVGTLGIIPKDEKMIYLGCLGGHVYWTQIQTLNKRKQVLEIIYWIMAKNSGDSLEGESV